MDACMFAGSGQGYCSSALEEIQERYTVDEFAVLETRMLNTGQMPEELAGVTAKCIQLPLSTDAGGPSAVNGENDD
jgi:hypothetical protein